MERNTKQKRSKRVKKRPSKGKASVAGQSAKLFVQAQSSDLCRMHAINNALGRAVISEKKFNSYCDKFDWVCIYFLRNLPDIISGQKYGCSGSREFFFMPNHNDNLLTFILHDLGFKTAYYPLRGDNHIATAMLDGCECFLCFSGSHVWAYRYHSGTWHRIDSLSGRTDHNVDPTQLSPRLGYIFIYQEDRKKTQQNQNTEQEKDQEGEREEKAEGKGKCTKERPKKGKGNRGRVD